MIRKEVQLNGAKLVMSGNRAGVILSVVQSDGEFGAFREVLIAPMVRDEMKAFRDALIDVLGDGRIQR